MANIFKPKRSTTAESVPTTVDLADGELAINIPDKKIYIRDDTEIVQINFSPVVEDTTPQLGGDLDLNNSDITGTGNINITGIITSSGGFVGDLIGTATTATNLADAANITTGTISDDRLPATITSDITGNAGTATSLATARNFEITGDVVASVISFDGTGNVSLAATIQPNSVALGDDTTGDFVQSITGVENEIQVINGTGEGSTPTIGFVDNPTIGGNVTIGQDLTVTRDLQVTRNLNVDGTITIGGTSATIFAETLKISDPDLILGFRTDAGGNDISNDTTANHGGVALASTEGSPLITLVNPGAGETLPATYKKIMWFKANSFTGLNTDAWLSNYAFGVGTTSMSAGTKFAVGNIEADFDDITAVRNINSSGVITATSLVSNVAQGTAPLTVTSNTLVTNLNADLLDGQEGSFYTNASNLASGTVPDARFPATLPAVSAVNLTGLTGAAAGTYGDASNVSQIVVDANGRITSISEVAISGSGGGGVTVQDEGIALSTIATTLNFVGAGVVATGTGATKTITISGEGVSSINAVDESADTTCFPLFATTATGAVEVKTDASGLIYDSANERLQSTDVAVKGAVRVENSASTERFEILYNETTDSLDFSYFAS